MHRFFPTALLLALLLPHAIRAEDRDIAKPYTQAIPDTNVTFEMMPIPSGKFMMGSPADARHAHPDETPQMEVRVDPFWMGKYVVTWPEYEAFYNRSFQLNKTGRPEIPTDRWADAVTYPTPLYNVALGAELSRMGRGKGHPAVSMSQYAARQYTKWLSRKTGRFYRLPTEAEWEYACRAGTTTAYHFGDDPRQLNKQGWFIDNSSLKDGDPAYHAVGQMPANAWGLFDMHGNVGQWCIDQYDPQWYAKFKAKPIAAADVINWPHVRYPIVIRGGGYESEAEDCRSASRLHSSREFNNKDPEFPRSAHWESNELWVGFRIVSPVKEPSEAEKQKFWDDPDPITEKTIRGQPREMHELLPAGTAK